MSTTARDALGLVGTALAKWTVDGVLGEGGMAIVYAAHHRNGHPVAIKVLRPEFATDADIQARFLREAYAANHVAHPGVVAVSDDGRTEHGLPFLVMERLVGESLDRRFARGEAFGPAEALSIVNRVLDVLAAAHDKQVFHRDLKPENIFLLGDGAIKILDFGIAQLRQESTRVVTLAGSVMGTPNFMPPEQARGRWSEVDARSDLFSLGATLRAMLTGRLPRDAATANEVLLAAMTSPIEPLDVVLPSAPPPLVGFVSKAVAMAPSARFQSAREMQAALRLVEQQLGAPPQALFVHATTLASPETLMASSASRHEVRGQRRVVVGAIAVGVVAALAVGYLALPSSPASRAERAAATSPPTTPREVLTPSAPSHAAPALSVAAQNAPAISAIAPAISTSAPAIAASVPRAPVTRPSDPKALPTSRPPSGQTPKPHPSPSEEELFGRRL